MPKKLPIPVWILIIAAVIAVPLLALAQTATPTPGNAFVMVGNFSPNSPPVDIYINGELVGDNLAFSQATFPRTVKAGDIFIQVYNANLPPQTGLIVDGYKFVNANDYYMLPVMNVVEKVQFGVYRIPVYEALGPTETRAQFFHAVPNGPRLDVLEAASKNVVVDAMGYVEDPRVLDHLPAGVFNWQVWTDYKTQFPGFTADPNAPPDSLVIDMGQLALQARAIYSFFVIGSPMPGGPPVLALVLAMPYGGGQPLPPPGSSFVTPTPGPSPTPAPTLNPVFVTQTAAAPTATSNPATATAAAAQGVTVGFSAANYSVNEGDNINITVRLNKVATQQVRVSYTASAGTATLTTDWTSTSATLVFNPGETEKTVQVQTKEDVLDEANETVNLTLTNPSGATLGQSTATLTIIDDDAPTLALTGATVDGVSTTTVPEGKTAIVTITLTGATSQPVSGTITTTSPGNGTDFTIQGIPFNFAASNTTPRTTTFTVPVTNDIEMEGAETIVLKLDNLNNATCTTCELTLTIPANDAPVPVVSMGNPSPTSTRTEGGASVTVPIAVSFEPAPGQPVTVTVSVSGTASVGDYTASPLTLNFAAGDFAPKNITVTFPEDSINEADEELILTITAVENATIHGTDFTETITILDNDPVTATISAPASNVTTDENAAIQVTIALDIESEQPLVVGWTLGGTATLGVGDDYNAPSSVTFNPGETSKSFNVNIFEDGIAPEPEETIIITLNAGLSDTEIGAPNSRTITINAH